MTLTPNDRKAELLRRGVTMSRLARELGVTVGHVSQVIAGKRRSPNVEQAVSAALGLNPSNVFPEEVASLAS